MKCSFCENKAIYCYWDTCYCKEHFLEYFREKALNTIEKYKLIEKGDVIGVAVSGGKDSLALLHFLSTISREFGIRVYGIHIDEGIKGYRDILTKYLKKVSEKHGWELRIYSFKELIGITLDEAVKNIDYLKACTICGVFRRWIMNYAANDLGLTKIATAHNLNDEAQTVIMNILEGNLKDLLKMGPKVGIISLDVVPRIKPFYFHTEKETMIYSILNGISPPWTECPYISGQIRDIVRKKLYELEDKYPGFHYNFVSTFLKNLEKLKSKVNIQSKTPKTCKYCGQPTSRDICRACEISIELLGRPLQKFINPK